MAPEYGRDLAAYFPHATDEPALYLRKHGPRRRSDRTGPKAYSQGRTAFWRDARITARLTRHCTSNMGTIVPAISGPKRPQDYIALTDAAGAFGK